ncbi:hypothetical protein THAOC_36007, partial [Thalassiosira oceanica]
MSRSAPSTQTRTREAKGGGPGGSPDKFRQGDESPGGLGCSPGTATGELSDVFAAGSRLRTSRSRDVTIAGGETTRIPRKRNERIPGGGRRGPAVGIESECQDEVGVVLYLRRSPSSRKGRDGSDQLVPRARGSHAPEHSVAPGPSLRRSSVRCGGGRRRPSSLPRGAGEGRHASPGRRFVDGRRRPPGVGRVDYANAPSSRGPPRGGAPSPPSDTLAGGRRDATDARRVRDERGLRPHLRRRPSPRGGVRRWRTRQWRGEGTGRVPPPAPPAVPRWTPRGGRSKAARPSAARTSRAPG